MEVRATAKYVRVQPRTVRIIADEVRGRPAPYTSSLLRYHPSKSARLLRKVLESAMANAQENHNLAPEQLRVAAITVDEGPRLKRMQARAMGRGNRILKKTSHITVVVEEWEGERKVKPHGTKAKPRPTFGKAAKRAAKQADAAVAKALEPAEEPVEAAPDTTAPETTAPETTAPEAAAPEETTAEAAAQPEEATPVTESDAPEEKGGAEEPAGEEETNEAAEGATGEAKDADEKGAE
jgi:large subunit ribosomal protein L22